MCTIAVSSLVHSDYPLIIAMNRDERYDRRSTGLQTIQALPLEVVAPWDLKSGGTWVGVGQGGWFVGLTNEDFDGEPGTKSRGQVVKDILLMSDHREAARYLNSIDPADYSPFNLVFGRPEAMFLCCVHRDKEVDLQVLDRGVHVIANNCGGTYYDDRIQTLEIGLRVATNSGDFNVNSLHNMMCIHDDTPDLYQSVCVHDDANSFGTISSTIIVMDKEWNVDVYHDEGHPCGHEVPTHVKRLSALKIT